MYPSYICLSTLHTLPIGGKLSAGLPVNKIEYTIWKIKSYICVVFVAYALE